MSVETIVVLRDERLPTRDGWQRGIDEAGIELQLDEIPDLRMHSGYLPARLNDSDSGFEWFYGKTSETIGDGIETPSGYGHAAVFVTHSDMGELICALLAAGCLAIASGGLFYEEENGAFAPGERSIEIARVIEQFERDNKRRLAEKDASITDQRCPSCEAPCPSYRKTCKACGADVRQRG